MATQKEQEIIQDKEVKEQKPIADKMKEDKPVTDKVKEDKPVADKAKEEKPVSDKAKEEKPVGDKVRTGKPEGERYVRKPRSFGDNSERRPRRPLARRKVCVFCVDKVEKIDYKDIARIRKFVTEKGKILPSRQTGTCSKHQRELTTAIKRARYMALLHYKGD